MKKDLSNTLISGICWDMAVVVRDLESTVKRLEELSIGLFVVPEAPEGAEGLFYNGEPLESEYKALVTRLGNMQIEIIQPDDKPNPWKEFLDTRGEGIHHICLEVDDIEKALADVQERGLQLIDEIPRTGPEGERFAFIHPKSTHGVLIELYEYPKSVTPHE